MTQLQIPVSALGIEQESRIASVGASLTALVAIANNVNVWAASDVPLPSALTEPESVGLFVRRL